MNLFKLRYLIDQARRNSGTLYELIQIEVPDRSGEEKQWDSV